MGTSWQHYQDTGYGPIDGEHREISDGLERLLEAVNGGRTAEALRALETLAGQIQSHFDHEELLMVESGYHHYARHKEAHDLFMGDATKYLSELREGGLTTSVRRWITGRVLVWFRFHITANDVELGVFLLEWEREGREPAVAADEASPLNTRA